MLKSGITKALAFIGYYGGIDWLFYRLNRRCKRVLTFHNVFPDALCRPDEGGGMSLSVSDFKRIIAEVAKVYRFSTDFEDTQTATITFDDGFLNQFEVAPEALGDIPAVLFVTGRNIDRTDPLLAPAVDLLTVWLDAVPQNVTGGKSKFRYWIEDLRPAYAKDATRYGRSVVERCDQIYPFRKILESLGPEYVRLRLGGISSNQLQSLRARGWKIGWHSASHYVLSAISEDRIAAEFNAPEEIKGVPMSYPYGELKSVGEREIGLARQAGFPSAYSNLPDSGGIASCYFLPRFTVEANKYLLHFHLSGFRHFLKNRKLLPKCG